MTRHQVPYPLPSFFRPDYLPGDVNGVASIYGVSGAVKAAHVGDEVGAAGTPTPHFAGLAPASVRRHQDVPARRTVSAEPGELDGVYPDPAPGDSGRAPGRIERVCRARRVAGARGVVSP